MRFLLPIVAVMLLSACGGSASTPTPSATPSPSPTPEVHQITGTLSLALGEIFSAAGPNFGAPSYPDDSVCSGVGGYNDIVEGAPVTVKNESGTIVAAGRLGAGKYTHYVSLCSFPIVVAGIPRASFYTIEVSQRGGLSYSYADLSGRNWAVTMTLGQ